MYVASTANPIDAIRAQARDGARPLPDRLRRFLSAAWQRHLERQMDRLMREMDHPGVVGDFMRASRRG